MRCPACETENPDKAKRCVSCGKRVPLRVRRRASRGKGDPSASPLDPGRRTPEWVAYRIGLFSLIPGLGLVLGPLALVLGIGAWTRMTAEDDPSVHGPIMAAVILGSATLIANVLGLTLIIWGLASGPSP